MECGADDLALNPESDPCGRVMSIFWHIVQSAGFYDSDLSI